MNISIKVINREPEIWNGSPHCEGEITIGNHKEGFMIPVDYWQIEDYENQWKEGLERIKNHDTSCFVTRIGNPKEGLYAMFWPLYKVGNMVYVREHLLIDEILDILIEDNELPVELKNIEFNNQTCYQFITPRTNEISEHPASEWSVNLDSWN